jgi:hypothetical protein
VIGTLRCKRRSGENRNVFYCPLPESELERIRSAFVPSWSNANKPWGEIDGFPIYRVNTLLVVIGPMSLNGKQILERHRG